MFSGFDEKTAQLNANKKCKLCHGRGFVKIRYPKYKIAVKDYCPCVEKKINNQQQTTLMRCIITITVGHKRAI